jgi:hypothetical protein
VCHLDERTAREYLELIAKENLRLSRLMDGYRFEMPPS